MHPVHPNFNTYSKVYSRLFVTMVFTLSKYHTYEG